MSTTGVKWQPATFLIWTRETADGPAIWDEVDDGFVWDIWGIAPDGGKSWVLTHLPTGRRIPGRFPSKQSVERWLNDVRDVVDWDSVTDFLSISNEIKQRISEASIKYLR